MATLLKKFWTAREGATAIEYALIASLISIVVLVVGLQVRGDLIAVFNVVSAALIAAVN